MDPSFETVYANDGSFFRSIHITCHSFSDDHTWHYHPEYELTYIMNSTGTRFVGDSIQPYAPGDLVLIGPNLPHCWHNDRIGDQKNNDAEVFVIQFSMESFGEHFFSFTETREFRSLLDKASSAIQFLDIPDQFVREKLKEIENNTGLSRLIAFIQLFEALTKSKDMAELASKNYHLVNDVNEVNRRRIEKIHAYIRDNLEIEFSQKDVADMVGLTPSAFSRFFKSATGMTFINFVNTIRISEACRMLTDENVDITQIAYACGYNNISNFNRQFLSLKGLNPSEFRRQWHKLESN